MRGYYIDTTTVVSDGWLILRDKDHKQIGSAHANSYELRMKLYERLKELNTTNTIHDTTDMYKKDKNVDTNEGDK